MFAKFKDLLIQLNDQEFIASTRNYRNLSHHQIEINFDSGLVPMFRRRKTEAGVAYEYIVIPPLRVLDLIRLLYAQHAIACDTFMAFFNLLEEQKNVWLKKSAGV